MNKIARKSLERRIKRIIKDIEEECRDNTAEIERRISCKDYADVTYLDSVNGSLEYVINRLESEIQ